MRFSQALLFVRHPYSYLYAMHFSLGLLAS